ncbi:Wall-associated receptor kinase 2 [Striga hermonthica]|uniref:Wall-associated receptor kinase 2 n=1 Tax=Striga hermonthica TaxID=68872 RepID=A0A9N7MQ48_STRHE|nr:Wall-associated receptor kinase 2 [Striga hermonthica]
MISQVIFVLTIMAAILLLSTEITSLPPPLPTAACPKTCGNVSIPFPFGTTPNCSLDHSFLVECDRNSKPFLNAGPAEILGITLDGLMRIKSSVATDCYDRLGSQVNSTTSELSLSKFTISGKLNKFMAVGCDIHALLQGSHRVSVGCASWCGGISSVVNGTCWGMNGCCWTSIPKGVSDLLVDIRSFRNRTKVNTCGYAFVVEEGAYEFVPTDLGSLGHGKSLPVVVEWFVGNVSCREARESGPGFACRANHSDCRDSEIGVGYICECLGGFEGNPYLADGCRDINECVAFQPCEGPCENLEGSYSCSCPEGFQGDGKKDGTGCYPHLNDSPRIINGPPLFIIYIALGFIIPAVVASLWIFRSSKENKSDRFRRDLFIRNGGDILKNTKQVQETVSVFTAQDIQTATNNCDRNNKVSKEAGANETYTGTLESGDQVTIEIQKLGDGEAEAFIARIVALSQIDSYYSVKLVGCCLETNDPMVIYEGITTTTKTLKDHILDDDLARTLSWRVRLRIAMETADVLEELHPVIHGRLSSSRILLLDDHNMKLCDFAITWPEVQTEESDDVYSFGVVLVELLIGEDLNLVQNFVESVRGDNLVRILDSRLEACGEVEVEMLMRVGKLADKCLVCSSHRMTLTMKEVAAELMDLQIKNFVEDEETETSSMEMCCSMDYNDVSIDSDWLFIDSDWFEKDREENPNLDDGGSGRRAGTGEGLNLRHRKPSFEAQKAGQAQRIFNTLFFSRRGPKPFLNAGPAEILGITLDGLMRIKSSVAADCYDRSGSRLYSTTSELSLSKFTISGKLNKFMAVGCDIHALVRGSHGWNQMSVGCASWCSGINSVVNGTCRGPTGRSKENKSARLKRDLFIRNGGDILKNMQQVHKTVSVFTAQDIQTATNNYDCNNKLYKEAGANETYKGTLESGPTNHPMVVYEGNTTTAKTLKDHIRDDDLARVLSWSVRLRIASKMARVLADLHHVSPSFPSPVIHGRVSSSAILLLRDYEVKLCDFVWPEHFVESVRGDVLVRILDSHFEACGEVERLMQVGKLAEKCLACSSMGTPTMEEVTAKLLNLIGPEKTRLMLLQVFDVETKTSSTEMEDDVEFTDGFLADGGAGSNLRRRKRPLKAQKAGPAQRFEESQSQY